jgi:hypothetical protein
MALSGKKPVGYPEISFLSFDVLALLARIQHEMELDSVGPVTFSLQAMETLACIRWEQGRQGGDIFFHSLFNRPDVSQPVIEHVLRHELLRLKIPPREIDGKWVHHPPGFWEVEQALVPWKSASWGGCFSPSGKSSRRTSRMNAFGSRSLGGGCRNAPIRAGK